MAFNNFVLVPLIIMMIYPSCYSRCDNYYILMEKYVDIDQEQLRPFPKGKSTWSITDSTTNRTTDLLDMNCVLDITCNGISTYTTKINKIDSVTGTDTRYFYSTPRYIPTTENIITDTDTFIKNTYSPFAPRYVATESTKPDDTTLVLPKKSVPIETTTDVTYPAEESDFENSSSGTEIIDTYEKYYSNTTEAGTTTAFSVDDEFEATSDKYGDITTELAQTNETLLGDDRRNVTNSSVPASHLHYNKRNSEDSKKVAIQVVAGTVGVATVGGAIFLLKKCIQNSLQSGVYRIP